jgi:site-specific DNA-methyltransferase (adenine-specific)
VAAFGHPRTVDHLVRALEEADFELRDKLTWNYATGFPKNRKLTGSSDGRGTALKPAYEKIVIARKPFKPSVQANFDTRARAQSTSLAPGSRLRMARIGPSRHRKAARHAPGRLRLSRRRARQPGPLAGKCAADPTAAVLLEEQRAGASKFFYVPKPSPRERDAGLGGEKNTHRCYKPIELMRYLVRMFTPTGGRCLGPFTGSGSTGCAAVEEGMRFQGFELDPEFARKARRRIAYASRRLR